MQHDAKCGHCGKLIPQGSLSQDLCNDCLTTGPTSSLDATQKPDGVSTTSSLPPSAYGHPERIGLFRILEVLGQGGMGVVYLAEQEKPLRRRVALKVIKLGMDTKEVIGRFESERQALAIMNHPNIARVLDAGVTEQGSPYFVMEHIAGISISDYCDRHRLNTRQRLELFMPVCQAVQHAHQNGIIHRDLKPSNVLVTLIDGKPIPKVIDFGVAKATNQRLTELTVFTQQGLGIGTPEYMSPEQAEMTGLDVDSTTDIYSLGVMLYELLVGTLPFDSKLLRKAGYDEMRRIIREQEPPTLTGKLKTLGDTAKQVAHHRHTDPESLGKQLQGDLDWITMRAMNKDRTRRYRSASEFEADILRHLNEEAVMASPPDLFYRLRKFAKRRRGLVAAAAAVLISLMLGLVLSTVLYFRSETARRFAEQQELLARRRLYAAQMTLAQQAWDANNIKRVRVLLEGLRPAPGQEDLRGFEWHYLWRLSHRDGITVSLDSQIISAAFSSNGRILTTGSYDGSVGFWNAISWKPIKTSIAHKGAVTSVAFSPTGKMVATSGEDGLVRYWDTNKLQVVTDIKGHSDAVQSIAFSPLGDQLATAGKDGTVKLWDVAHGKESMTLQGHSGPVRSVAFRPDGKMLASGGDDGVINIWNPVDGKKRTYFSAPATKITCLSFMSGGEWIVAGTESGAVLSWNVASGKRGADFEGHKSAVLSLALTPDERNLATGDAQGGVRVWNSSTRETTAILNTADVWQRSPVFSLAFSPDGRILTSTGMETESRKSSLKVWDLAPGQELSLPVDKLNIPGMLVTTQASTLAYAGERLGWGTTIVAIHYAQWERPWGLEKGTVNKWHLALRDAFDSRVLINAVLRRVSPIAFSRGGKLFAASDMEDAALRIWETATGKEVLCVYKLPGTQDTTAIALTNQILAAAGYDGQNGKEVGLVRLWDLGSRKEVGTLTSKSGSIVSLQISPSGKLLAALTRSDTWSARMVMSHTCPLEFSPDERTLATDDGDFTLMLWDLPSGKERYSIQAGKGTEKKPPVKSVSTRTGIHGTSLELWDVASGKEIGILSGHESDINCVAFSLDGRRLVTGGQDGSIKIWDLLTGQELYTLITQHGSVYALAFSSDGSSLSASFGSGVKIWHAPDYDQRGRNSPSTK